jgi:hypothetical protein
VFSIMYGLHVSQIGISNVPLIDQKGSAHV